MSRPEISDITIRFTNETSTAIVMNQNYIGAGAYIIRVDVVDREVVHPLEAGPDLYRGDGLGGFAVGVAEFVAGLASAVTVAFPVTLIEPPPLAVILP